MAIQFNCPYCTSSIRVADAAAGKIGKCPKCGTKLRVPKPEIPQASPPTASPDAPRNLEPVAAQQPLEELRFTGWGVDPVSPRLADTPVAPAVEPPQPGWDANPFAPFNAPAAVEPIDTTPSLLQRRRRQPSLWVKAAVPLLFVAILLVIGGVYWRTQRPTMTGELPGERLPPDTMLSTSIPPALVDAPKEAYDAAVSGLIETPQTISTDLMFVEIVGGPEGLQVRLQAGPDTELVRVDVRRNPLLAQVAQDQAENLNADRLREFRDAAREFVEAWRDSRSAGMQFGNTAAYRDKLGINALLRGVGYHSTAIVDRKAYPCVHEDEEGRLYFVLPRGTTTFDVTERQREGQGSVFPGEYRFNVTVAPAAAATSSPSEETEQSDSVEPKDDRPAERPTEMPAPADDVATPDQQ
jgi:hypothetical protein